MLKSNKSFKMDQEELLQILNSQQMQLDTDKKSILQVNVKLNLQKQVILLIHL